MGYLWMGYFLATIAAFGGILAFGVACPLLLLGYVHAPARRAGERVMCSGIQWLLRVQLWLRAEVRLANLRHGGGYLTVSNHRSHLDVFFLIGYIPGVRILAKASLFKVPFLGLMMRLMRQLRVPRGNYKAYVHAMDRVRELLAAGEHVHIFPEMTRCVAGMPGVQTFSLLPFAAALRAGVPIIPIVFSGTDVAWPKGYARLCAEHKVKVAALPAVDSAAFANATQLKDFVHNQIVRSLQP